MTFNKDETEVLYHGLSKSALLSLEIEPMFVEDVQDLYYDCMVFLLSLATKDEDIIHVDDHNTFVDELSEDIIHHCLEIVRLLVRPKNMTRGSNRSQFIRKAAFH